MNIFHINRTLVFVSVRARLFVARILHVIQWIYGQLCNTIRWHICFRNGLWAMRVMDRRYTICVCYFSILNKNGFICLFHMEHMRMFSHTGWKNCIMFNVHSTQNYNNCANEPNIHSFFPLVNQLSLYTLDEIENQNRMSFKGLKKKSSSTIIHFSKKHRSIEHWTMPWNHHTSHFHRNLIFFFFFYWAFIASILLLTQKMNTLWLQNEFRFKTWTIWNWIARKSKEYSSSIQSLTLILVHTTHRW